MASAIRNPYRWSLKQVYSRQNVTIVHATSHFAVPARFVGAVPQRDYRGLFYSPMRIFLLFLPTNSGYKVSSFPLGDYWMPKKSKRRSWTSSDVRTLKTMARRKTGAASIARSLKRTEGATRQKAFSLGLSLDSRA